MEDGEALVGSVQLDNRKMNSAERREECINKCFEASVSACFFSWDGSDKGCYGIYGKVDSVEGGGKYACMRMTPEKKDNFLHFNQTYAESLQEVTETEFQCSEMGFYDWQEVCRVEYMGRPCDMEHNNCTLYYYDMNWNWHADNCTNNLSDPYEWNMNIKDQEAWKNESIPEAKAIWSFWMDWHEEHDDDFWGSLNFTTDDYNYTDWNATEWNNTNGTNMTNETSHWRHNTSLYRDLDSNPMC